MDELRELAVRTALFQHLDELLLASDDDTLGWNQTESFQFNGEAFSIRQARGRGISKPAGLSGALSITTAFTPFGSNPLMRTSRGTMVIRDTSTREQTLRRTRIERSDSAWNTVSRSRTS